MSADRFEITGAPTMSQTADQHSADQASGDVPPHRYTPALAHEIELAWQDRWAREGTFHTPNPTGRLLIRFSGAGA